MMGAMKRRFVLAGIAVAGALLAGCGGNAGQPAAQHSSVPASAWKPKPLPWNRPADQQAQVKAAGLSLTRQEQLTVHYHAHLDVFVNGRHVTVPPGLGINIGPDGQAPPHGSPGIAPLHTHEPDGVLHIEAPRASTFTLGQAFVEWGVRLTAHQAGAYRPLRVYVNGHRFSGNPADVVLKAHREIAVVAGTGKVQVPASYDFPPGE